MTITSLSARKFSLSSKLQVLFLCQLLGPFQLYNDIRFNIADVENTCNFVVLLTPVFSSTYIFTVDRTKVTMSFESYNRSEKMQQSRLCLSKSVLITSVFPSTRKARTKWMKHVLTLWESVGFVCWARLCKVCCCNDRWTSSSLDRLQSRDAIAANNFNTTLRCLALLWTESMECTMDMYEFSRWRQASIALFRYCGYSVKILRAEKCKVE